MEQFLEEHQKAQKLSHHDYFFNLETYSHKQFFDSFLYPWEILNRIKSFTLDLPLGKIEGRVSSQAYLLNPELIFIGSGTIVEPGAYIQGPCYIGKHCTIRHGAYIRGNFICGDQCVIGHDTEIKNALFLNHVAAAHFAYVADSIVGNKVNLGAGVKCANLRLDHAQINLRYRDERIHSNLKKMGAIIGDNSQIGCNTVLNPGTLLGQEVHCAPCINLGGFVPSKSFVQSTSTPIIKPIC